MLCVKHPPTERSQIKDALEAYREARRKAKLGREANEMDLRTPTEDK